MIKLENKLVIREDNMVILDKLGIYKLIKIIKYSLIKKNYLFIIINNYN